METQFASTWQPVELLPLILLVKVEKSINSLNERPVRSTNVPLALLRFSHKIYARVFFFNYKEKGQLPFHISGTMQKTSMKSLSHLYSMELAFAVILMEKLVCSIIINFGKNGKCNIYARTSTIWGLRPTELISPHLLKDILAWLQIKKDGKHG